MVGQKGLISHGSRDEGDTEEYMTRSVEENVRVSSALFTSINELTTWAQCDLSGM